jgi:hypothetical protein
MAGFRDQEGSVMGFIAVMVLLLGVAHAPTTFNLSADFSLQNNPNKDWQYGYSETNSLAADQFRIDKYSEMQGPIGFWHPATNNGPGPGYYPYVAYNTSKQSEVGSKGWAVHPGEVAMEASNTGQYALVRFVAPASGVYEIVAKFAGIHFGLSTTDVHVLHNGTSLFDADIDGYGGDPSFHQVQGSSPTAAYSSQIEMKASDTVTFAVGYGKNKTNYGDTTGLFARIVWLAEGGSKR